MGESSKQRLGRGLSALIGDAGAPAEHAHAVSSRERVAKFVPIEALVASPQNPRGSFEPEALEELAQSIAKHGVLQPILVRVVDENYEIIAGERRWRAAQRAGLHQVPVVVRNVAASEALEIALIENVQRTDLNPIEEARGYQRLIDEYGHSQDALAKLIGKSRSHVANTLRLMNLPPSIRASVTDGSLTAGHARTLLAAPNPEAAADEVIRKGLSVRATEALVALRIDDAKPRPPRQHRDDPDSRAVSRRLSNRLGLKVSLKHNMDETGVLTIRYSNVEQLDAVCRLLGEG